MLTITYNGNNIPLDPGFSMRLTWTNPACFFDKIPGDTGVGITIPVNDYSRAIFGSPHRFEKYHTGTGRKFNDVEIRFKGMLLMSGALVITRATPENYDAWLQSNLGVMGEEQQTKNITDMDWPTSQSFANQTSYDDDDDDYTTFSIFNRNFWEGKGKETTVPIEYTDEFGRTQTRDETRSVLAKQHLENFLWLVNYPDPGTGVETDGDACVVSPFLHLRYVIKKSLQLNNWYISRNDITDDPGYDSSFLKNLSVYNNFNIMDIEYSSREVDIKQWDYDDNQMEEQSVREITITEWVLTSFNYADLLPKISYKKFLLGIQNSLNYIFRFKGRDKVDIIDRNAILSGDYYDVSDYSINEWEIGEKKDGRLKFVTEYDKNDGMFDTNFEDLSDRWADYGEPVNTVELLESIPDPQLGELRLVLNTNEVYEYKWMVATNETPTRIEEQLDVIGWELASTGPQPYIFGDGEEEEEIHTGLSTLQRTPGVTLHAMQKGNIDSMRSRYNDFSLRLLPGALNKHDYLWWEGSVGLFANRWEKWATFWKERTEATGQFNFPLNVLLYIVENITGKLRSREGEFIIAEMSTEFGLDMIGTTTIKGYKI